MGLLVSWLAAALLAFTIFFYVAVYTMWLKRSTPQNIVIGGAAGAFPPMIGWAAATGGISLEPCLLFLIIFVWTPPHFWALSLLRVDDYARARVPMLPVVAGRDRNAAADRDLFGGAARRRLGALVHGLCGRDLRRDRARCRRRHGCAGVAHLDAREGERAAVAAKQLFAFSILYLFILFAVLLVEAGFRGGSVR